MPEMLLCFGGPRNGQLVSVDRTPILVAIPPRFDIASFAAAEFYDVMAVPEPLREVRYDVEKVFLHDTTMCHAYPAEHGEWCHVFGRCLVAAGFPKHRITDAITALGVFTVIAPFTRWAQNPTTEEQSGND